jgi:hypothetical protein
MKDPFDIEERSSLWQYGATAAVVGGVGYGIYRAHPAIRAVLAGGRRDVASEVTSELRTLGRFNVAPGNASAASYDVGENILRGLAESASGFSSTIQGGKHVRMDIAHAAYEAMLAGGKATHTEAYTAYQEILNQSSVRNAYEAARQSIGRLQGDTGLLMTRLGELGPGGFYTPSRLHEMARAGTSTGGFTGVLRHAINVNDLSTDIRNKAELIRSRLNTAAQQSGGLIDWKGVYEIEDVIGGKRVTTPMLRGTIGSEAINIPLSETGMTYGGQNLTARYITRKSYGATGGIVNYTDEYVSRLERTMLAQKTKTGLKNAVIDANREIIESMRLRDSAARSMAVWKMPEPMLTAGGRVKARMNLMEAVYSGGNMTEDLRNKIIQESLAGGRSLYPIGSPETVAKGTFLTRNMAEDLFGPMGRLMGIEQRPTQFIREQFGVTAAAKANASRFRGTFGQYFSRLDRKIQGPGYKSLLYGGADILSTEAYSAPQLVAFYAKPGMLETGSLAGKMSKEEAILSARTAPMMEYERIVQKKITLKSGFRVNQNVLDALSGKQVGELATLPAIGRGGFVGIEAATGREVWAEGAKGAEARIVGAQLTDQNAATVFLKEQHRINDQNYWKFFSEDVKFMGKAANDARMRDILSTAGMGELAGSQNIEAVVSGKLVQRNRMALMTQQIEALSMLTAAKIDKRELTLRRRLLAQEFMSDPAEFLKVDKLMQGHITDAEFQIQKNMVALTKKFGFSELETGLTFGLMDSGIATRLGISNAVTNAPGVIGLSKMRLGDFGFEGGAGGVASFEQTGFRLLSMKGEEGKRFAAEMATRLYGKNELVPANMMMASVLNERDTLTRLKQLIGSSDMDERLLGQLTPDALIKESGRYVGLGRSVKAFGGASNIYIPGINEAESLMGYSISDKGLRIPSPVAGDLEELRSLMSKGADEAEIEAAASRLRSTIVQQTESQATAKGKVIGSRFLTGIEQTALKTSESAGAFGISQRTGERMFDELIDRAQSHEQRMFLTEQKRKLIEEGHELVGGMWRHPTTGPESFQFVRYKVDRNLADEMISAPFQTGEIFLGSKRKSVDVSPMVGMKGDFDKDMFAIAAISDRDTAGRVTSKMKNEIQEGYTAYLFNHYAMKDMIDVRKGNIDSLLKLNHEEAMMQGARNLTTAKIATPQVNIALQKLKLGLQYNAPEQYRPMAELFWHLEESAISGKHGAQQNKLYQEIAHAVNQKDAAGMESVIKQLMGEQSADISGRIVGPSGQLTSHTLKYTPKAWAEQAIQSAMAAGEDVEIAYKAAQATKGIVPEDLPTLTEMYYRRRTGSLDVAQAVMHSQAYGMPGFTEQANRALRKTQSKTRAIFNAVKKGKAPILIGSTIAAGVMLSAPSISGTIAPTEGPNGGRNLSPDDLGPPRGLEMNAPPPQIMESPKVYDMSGLQVASRANIRMSMSDANRSSRDFMRHASVLARGGNVRIRTHDDREALNPHRLANKIHERL